MKVLLINGSPNEHGCTYTALHEVETTLQRHGIETELLYLGKKPVAGCIACMKCFETGHCFRDDAVREIQDRLAEFDAIILGSPVYYSGPTGQILSSCQRLFFCKEGEMTGKFGASSYRVAAEALRSRSNSLTSFSPFPTRPSSLRNTGTRCTASLPTMCDATARGCRPCGRSMRTWCGC